MLSFAERQAGIDRATDKLLKWLEEERQKYWSKQDPNTPGIKEFYSGKNILVTGATGFIGKVLVEHLLRLVPGVGKIFVIIRVKRNQVESERLNTILNSELFGMLRTQQPEAINKVVAISGDLSEKGIGLSQEDRIILQNEVSVVFHAAATIRFDDPLRNAVILNTRGTHELVELSKSMRNLHAFVHVSTLYCNTDQKLTLERVYPTPYDWRTIIKMAEKNSKMDLDALSLKIIGYQPNTYTFTKQLAEKIVDDAGREIPVIIIRPGVVIPLRGDPLNGYLENLNGPTGFMAGVLPGVIRIVQLNKDVILNLTSVDITVRNLIAAGWSRGTNQRLKCEYLENGERYGKSFLIDTVGPKKTYKLAQNGVFGFLETVVKVRVFLSTALEYVFFILSYRKVLRPDVQAKLSEDPHMTDVINVSAEDVVCETYEHLRAVMPDVCKIVHPRCIQAPRLSFTQNAWVYRYKMFISHILFGLIVDFVLRLLGMKPRLMKVYRKVHIVNQALLYFLMNQYPSESVNFWKSISMVKEKEFQPNMMINLLNDSLAQWKYFCKNIMPQEPGNPTVFNLLEILEYIKSALKFALYFWILWKLLLLVVLRLA